MYEKRRHRLYKGKLTDYKENRSLIWLYDSSIGQTEGIVYLEIDINKRVTERVKDLDLLRVIYK